MKTAISVDGELMKAADSAARKLGVSRSRLFAIALEKFLRDRRNDEMLEMLNRVYGGQSDPDEHRIVAGFKTKLRSVLKDRW
jgi:metal-responsive CopG/Arc/MetJ family transcriptional regulator